MSATGDSLAQLAVSRHGQLFHVLFPVRSICKPLTRFRGLTVPLFLIASGSWDSLC
jgi:hypothetical protein